MATPEAGEPHVRFDKGARLGAGPDLDRSSRVRRGVRSPGLSDQCSTLPLKELFLYTQTLAGAGTGETPGPPV